MGNTAECAQEVAHYCATSCALSCMARLLWVVEMCPQVMHRSGAPFLAHDGDMMLFRVVVV